MNKITSISKSPFSDLYKIHLESGHTLPVSAATISEFVLFKNKDVPDSLLDSLVRQSPIDRLNEYAVKSLQRKSRTVYELKKYLKYKTITAKISIQKEDLESAIDSVINRLISKNLIDDIEYTKTYVDSIIHSRKSPSRFELSNKLRLKGVSPDTISDVLNSYVGIDRINLINAAATKYRQLKNHKNDPLIIKQKLYRFLIGKGYRLDMSIEALINEVSDAN